MEYTLYASGQIVERKMTGLKHVGWFLDDKRVLSIAPYQNDKGVFGFSLTHEYPQRHISYSVATASGKQRLFEDLRDLRNDD